MLIISGGQLWDQWMGMFSPHSPPPPIITICNILTIVKNVVINTLSHKNFEEIVTELVKISTSRCVYIQVR